jgi:uncharacterized FAD-dependent dehydrogenase
MTYKILSTRQIEETLITTVEYSFDNEIVVVDVPHFMPQNSQVIIQNIVNRAETEITKFNAMQLIPSIIGELIIGEVNAI